MSEALDRLDVLNQVLEIVDMFEDENLRMAADIVQSNPVARRLALSGVTPDDDELAKLHGEVGNMHVAIVHGARMIGDAIREKFGLPPKKDED